MIKIIAMILVLIAPNIVHAATCAAGEYLDGTTCRECKYGKSSSQAPVYCPGDDIRHDCPTSDTNYSALAAEFGHTIIRGGELNIWTNREATNVLNCQDDIEASDQFGNRYLAECSWNGSNYYSPCISTNGKSRTYLYHTAATGYYLSGYNMTSGTKNFYNGAKACTNKPANSHYTGAGTSDDPVKSGGVTDYNDCPWECDSGYGLHDGVCTTLCNAGFTQLKTSSGVTVNVYADKPSTPALNISTSRGTCYVTLASGAANNAINVNYNGTTYHTTD